VLNQINAMVSEAFKNSGYSSDGVLGGTREIGGNGFADVN
jgi:hypothetical protein